MAQAEPGGFEHAPQRAHGVAAVMVMRGVVRAPQPRHCGHGDEHPPARRELGAQHRERGAVLGDMLEHIEQHDQIVGAVRDRRAVGGEEAAAHVHPAAPRRHLARRPVGLDRVHLAETLEQGDVRSGAAADLEDPRIGLERHLRLDQRGDDRAACGEPPVRAVDLGHAVVDRAVHVRRPRRSARG